MSWVPLFIGRALRIAAGLGSMACLSRLLSPQEYGLFALLWLIYQSIAPLLDASLSASLSTFLATSSAVERRGVLGGTSLLLIGLGTVLGAGTWAARGLLAAGFDAPGLGAAALPFAIFLPAAGASLSAEGVFLGLGRPRIAGAMVSVQSVLRLGGTVAGAAWIGGAHGALWGVAAAAWAGAALQIGLTARITGVPRRGAELLEARRVFLFSGVLSLGTALGTLSNQFGRFALSVLEGPVALALYSNGAVENPVVALVTGSLMASLVPQLARDFARQDVEAAARKLRDVAARSAEILFPVLLFTLLAADELVLVLFGPRYAESAIVVRILAFIIPVRCFSFGPTFVAARRPRIIVGVTMISLACSVVFALALIPPMGIAGAALASAATTWCAALAYLYLMKTVLGIRTVSVLPVARLGLLTVLSMATAAALLVLPAPGLPLARLVTQGLAFGVTYGGLLLLTNRVRSGHWWRRNEGERTGSLDRTEMSA